MKKFAFPMPKADETVTADFLGQEVEIITIMSLEIQMELIRDYIESYFAVNDGKSFGRYNFFEADLLLKMGLIDKLTNIKVDAKKFDINLMEAHGIMELLEDSILNFSYFMERLEETVAIIEQEKESEKTLGAVIENVVSKLLKFADGLKIEDIEKVKQGVSDILKQVDESPASKYLKGQ